jgi:hypothetical protein
MDEMMHRKTLAMWELKAATSGTGQLTKEHVERCLAHVVRLELILATNTDDVPRTSQDFKDLTVGVALVLNRLGIECSNAQFYREAGTHFRRALRHFEEVSGPSDPNIRILKANIESTASMAAMADRGQVASPAADPQEHRMFMVTVYNKVGVAIRLSLVGQNSTFDEADAEAYANITVAKGDLTLPKGWIDSGVDEGRTVALVDITASASGGGGGGGGGGGLMGSKSISNADVQAALDTLGAMGFKNRERNLDVLATYRGNVDAAVHFLLQLDEDEGGGADDSEGAPSMALGTSPAVLEPSMPEPGSAAVSAVAAAHGSSTSLAGGAAGTATPAPTAVVTSSVPPAVHNIVAVNIGSVELDGLKLLQRYAANVNKDVTNPKYRKIKLTNTKFADTLWRHEAARTLLARHGWSQDIKEGFIVLPLEVGVGPLVAVLQEEIEEREMYD